jgi:hypothetical protein
MRNIIRGTYNTAPFSKWSYSEFIAVTNPFLLIIVILLCISVFSEKEVSVKRIVYAAPISQGKYYSLKALSITVVFMITAAIPIIMSFIYYSILFDYHGYAAFINPIILFLFPPFIFILGLSMVLGKINVKLLYVLLPIIFLGCSFNFLFPVWIDLCGNNFLFMYGHEVSGTIVNGWIPYALTSNFIYSRLLFMLMGIVFFIGACVKGEVKAH